MTGAMRGPALAGLIAALAVQLFLALVPADWRTVWREGAFDLMLEASAGLRTQAPGAELVFVDIDAASLAAHGPWPWRRDVMAGLVSRLAEAKPAVIALDILFAGEDTLSPAALARRLARETGTAGLSTLAEALPDGDAALAVAFRSTTVIVGAVMADGGPGLIAPPVIAVSGVAPAGPLWAAQAVFGPPPAIVQDAAGVGVMSLAGDPDGVTRRVPVLTLAGGSPTPGLAAEALRAAREASLHLYDAPRRQLRTGESMVTLPRDGQIRLLPVFPGVSRTVSAGDVLRGLPEARVPTGAIIFVGGSAPELGGLRNSLAGPLTPSALLQAQALRQLEQGASPRREPAHAALEGALAALAAALAIAAALLLRPGSGALALAALLAVVLTGPSLAAAWDQLVDPVPASLSAAFGFATAALTAFARNRSQYDRLRQRFAQHLAPAVVQRILDDPSALKLAGERRSITALFSDIENFTPMSGEAEPAELIELLDGYFEGVVRIVTAHGGLVDKFVGDAVHAFFNMPLSQDDHAGAAIRCAREVIVWTEQYRQTALARRLGLGRTRIGIESGPAIVGDVGRANKLNYTAYGAVVNTAARLEAMNKELGTAVCIGPVAAAGARGESLTPLGSVMLKGLGETQVFTVGDSPSTP
jgi:adenylate cyclase